MQRKIKFSCVRSKNSSRKFDEIDRVNLIHIQVLGNLHCSRQTDICECNEYLNTNELLLIFIILLFSNLQVPCSHCYVRAFGALQRDKLNYYSRGKFIPFGACGAYEVIMIYLYMCVSFDHRFFLFLPYKYSFCWTSNNWIFISKCITWFIAHRITRLFVLIELSSMYFALKWILNSCVF